MEKNNFVHLHVHTEYSLLDGACRIKELVSRAAELGFDALAITDHGVMYGEMLFYLECREKGIKPILGCEVYVANGDLREKTASMREYSHLILLAKDNAGYKNLMRLVSIGAVDGYYYKPRIDYPTLKQYSEGLICLSACLAGDIPQLLLRGDYEGAKKLAVWFKDVFGEDFYIELQDHGMAEQRRILPELIKLGRELDIPLAVTNDVHYILQEDAEAQNVLMCIQTASYIDDNKMAFETEEFYLKSADEMASLFSYVPDAIENTAKIAEKCSVTIDFDTYHLPKFDVPTGYTNTGYLDSLARAGAAERYGELSAVSEQLEFELKTIHSMGFTDYFLIVWDFIHYAKSRGIRVGPGRGSAAGSIVAYSLHITDIDPVKYDLLFERFLNPERITMPDIDIDFCFERRGEVIDYVVHKYGEDRVAQIITFGTLGAKQVVRDVARVTRISIPEADRIAKMIPFELKMTIAKAIDRNPKLGQEYNSDANIKKWLDMSMNLEGMPRQASTHAAGVVISREPITEYVPLTRNKKDDSVTTQFDMTTIERLGLLKMDFLGLRTLTVIRDAIELVRKTRGVEIDIDSLPTDDPQVYALISSGQTDGMFQLESGGMRDLMTKLRPETLGDIMVGISLYRPGPMAKIPDYIRGKNAHGDIEYDHPVLREVLSDTYGCMVYQEQVMQIVRKMAGYSMGRADLVRRAMSKKKADVMAKERNVFLYGDGADVPGAVANGVPEAIANRVFDEMTDFAEYAFNKSHACAYAVVAYQTAYLKKYYEPEMMTALLNVYMGDQRKFQSYITYIVRSDIDLLPPDINRSMAGFSVENGAVRFGLSALKQVGESISDCIAERDKNGPFTGFSNFIDRCVQYINKAQIESLIYGGALDSLDSNRARMIQGYEVVYKAAAEKKRVAETGQLSLFDALGNDSKPISVQLPDVQDYPQRFRLSLEKERAGVYISGHPLAEYKNLLSKQKLSIAQVIEGALSVETAQEFDGKIVELTGIISRLKVRSTKRKQLMADLTLEDLTDEINVVVFPSIYPKAEPFLAPDSIVTVTGKVLPAEDGPPDLSLIDVRHCGAPPKTLWLRIEKPTNSLSRKLKEVLSRYPGTDGVVFFVVPEEKRTRHKTLRVSCCDELIQTLESMLGQGNVAVK